MNTLILYTMGIASLVIIIAGAFFVVVMIVYYIQVMWSKISACAKNTMEYLQNKQDFEVYKADVLHWDMVKREKALRCQAFGQPGHGHLHHLQNGGGGL